MGEEIVSARLREVRRSGDVEALWSEVAERGAPLVEAGGDAACRLVTFLFRGTPQTRHVVVCGGPAGFDLPRNRMARLGDSDLWYRSYALPADTRCYYYVMENGPLAPPWAGDGLPDLEELARADPLNPRRATVIEEEGEARYTSLLELPDAPALRWSRDDGTAPRGATCAHTLDSVVMGHGRPLFVHAPHVSLGPPRALLVVFDGVAFTRTVPTPAIVDNLMAAGRIPPTLTVLVDSLGARRNRDLPCSRRFARFLADELMPWIEQRHGRFGAEQVVLAGASFGGLCSAHAAFRYPRRFGNVLSLSGSYWAKTGDDREWAALPRLFEQCPTLPLRFYVNVGLFEASSRIFADAPCQLVANRRMRDVLQSRGYDLGYSEYPGGHDWICWEQSLPDGLIALLGG